MPKRINYNDLIPWFTMNHADLPPRYVARTQKFFDELGNKHQATSAKRQAAALWRPGLRVKNRFKRKV